MDTIIIKKIESIINERIFSIKRINVGYSREVYLINHKYVLKIVKNKLKEQATIREIEFLEKKDLTFIPNVIYKDLSKAGFPCMFYLETKMPGELLLSKWAHLSDSNKEQILNRLIKIIEIIHSQTIDSTDCLNALIEEYDMYLNRIVDNQLLKMDKVKYLEELKLIIPTLFENDRIGLIHGDLHFNNIIISPNNDLSIIDFEKIKTSYIDREYDPINRMIRNPNSFVNGQANDLLDPRNFKGIFEYIKQHSDEISDDRFTDRLLFFDLMNSLLWFPNYPNNPIYNDVMFKKSKKLLK